MNRSPRVFGAALVIAALVIGLANPAAAAPAPSGEVLASYGTDCGVLTVTRDTPAIDEAVTVSLSRSRPNAEIPVLSLWGIYKGGRWFPFSPETNASDGQIDLSKNILSSMTLTTDAHGDATRTGTIAELLLNVPGGVPLSYINLLLTFLPAVWAVQCDEGVSFAQVRGARASLPGTLSLDPNAPGSILGSGLPADTKLSGLITRMEDYPDPGIAAWHGLINGSSALGLVQGVTDSLGTLASRPLGVDLPPGRYALGIASGVINVQVLALYKAEYVITVADDLSMTMELWTDPAESDTNSVALSLEAAIGAPVAGSRVDFSASALKPYTDWALTVHSTPQELTHGIAGISGILRGSAVLPAGLEAGWHYLTFSSFDAPGTAGESKYWFRVGANGELLEVSATEPVPESAPAMLAATGQDSAVVLPLSAGVLILGFALVLATRRRRASAWRS